MDSSHLVNRFDIFEYRFTDGLRHLIWHGTYSSFEETEKKLREFAAESTNEFYIKDLQFGLVVARANTADSAKA